MAQLKKKKVVAARREIRAYPEAPLHARIAAAAQQKRMSLGNYVLLAAEEKLARDAKADGKEAA